MNQQFKIHYVGIFSIIILLTCSIAFSQSILPDSLVKSITETVKTDTATIQAGNEDQSAQHGIQAISDNLNPPTLSELISFPKIIGSLIFGIIGFFLIRLVNAFLNTIAIRRPKYLFTIKRAIPIVRILGWTLVVYIIIVGIFHPPAATLFAFLTSIGVAVGFASQDLLKNVFGGLVVMFDRPFQIGDKIQTDKYYGEVKEIGIRSTRIVTADDSMVTIPNSEFMVKYVSNSNSGENNCQVVTEIYLPVDVDTEKVREIASEAAKVSRYIYLNKPVVILFANEFKDRRLVLKMKIKAYVSDLTKEFVFKSEITEIVLKELIKQNILKPEYY
ncbi:MAG: mechanosensitive ion channel family protein [Bacteroidales bacterium]|nr:mechanosensitive ion channel family protein [Bacteroidales bacterium]